jgi:hypothetical protein
VDTPNENNRPLISQGTAVILGVLATIVILSAMVFVYIMNTLPPPEPTPTPLPPTPTPVVLEWRELGYLTSAEFTAATVVELQRERFGPDETILLMVVGKIQTGIEMGEIKDSDVKVEGTMVEIVLPRAMVTSVDLIPSQTRIFDRGWFPGEGLETEALDKGRTQLQDWVTTESNLLDISERLAKAQLENFLRQLGFEQISITFKQREL